MHIFIANSHIQMQVHVYILEREWEMQVIQGKGFGAFL